MKTINLAQLGKIRFERTLVKVDYPILFICQNERGKQFLFVERESDREHEQWVAIETNDDTVNKMYRKDLSIQKAFSSNNVDSYYLVNHSYADDLYSCEIIKEFPRDVLSDGDDFIPFVDNTNLILNSAKIVTDRTNSPVLDFHLNPYSHKHSIQASLLAFISEKVLSIYKNITFKNRDDLMVEFEPGSFVLRFYSQSLDNLIPDNSSISAFHTISNILAAESVNDISKEIVQNPKIISPSRELLNRLSKQKEDFNLLVTDNVEQHDSFVKHINVDHLLNINKELKKYSLKENEIIIKNGILKSYDSIRKAFKFKIDDDGSIIKGNWSREFKDKKYVVHERYRATISVLEERYDDVSNSKFKIYYKLIKLEK